MLQHVGTIFQLNNSNTDNTEIKNLTNSIRIVKLKKCPLLDNQLHINHHRPHAVEHLKLNQPEFALETILIFNCFSFFTIFS